MKYIPIIVLMVLSVWAMPSFGDNEPIGTETPIDFSVSDTREGQFTKAGESWGAANLQCSWTGTWTTEWGDMYLTQSGSSVTGNYVYNQGTLVGTLDGNVLKGTWREKAPEGTAIPDHYHGSFEFTMADNCASWSSKYNNDDQKSTWKTDWNGKFKTTIKNTPVKEILTTITLPGCNEDSKSARSDAFIELKAQLRGKEMTPEILDALIKAYQADVSCLGQDSTDYTFRSNIISLLDPANGFFTEYDDAMAYALTRMAESENNQGLEQEAMRIRRSIKTRINTM